MLGDECAPADVAAVLHIVEVDGLHTFVDAIERGLEIVGGGGDGEDAASGGDELAIFEGGAGVEDDDIVALVFSTGEGIAGYTVSHPWRAMDPPALNSRLGELPDQPETYYIHDIALLPELHGTGAAALAVALLLARAGKEKLATASLVAVNDSAGFWERHGFRKVTSGKIIDATLVRKLRGYGGAATFMVRQL